MKLVLYPEYKNPGVSWIGKIPIHWTEKRAKYYFKEIDDRSQTGDEEMLSVSHITGVTPRSQKKVTMFKAESNIGQKLCQPGDLVINTMWAWMAALGVSSHVGIVSPSYGVYRPRNDQDYDRFYLDRLLRIEGYRSEYICRSTGIRSSRLRLYPDKFLSMDLICPPQKEQNAITRFLKSQDVLFRKFIHNKQELIKLLEERRLVVTNLAISDKGTDFVRFGSVAEKILRPITRISNRTYIPIGLYNRGRGMFHKEQCLGSDLGDSSFFYIKEGDLIFSGQFAWEGAVAVAGSDYDGCIASHRYPIFRGIPGLADTAYLFSFFRTDFGQMLLEHNSRGAAGRNRPLNDRKLMKEKIPVPRIELQASIGAIFEQEIRLRRTVAGLTALVKEYRTQLIADVVTGKLDVQEAAANLPDEPDGLEIIDEEDEIADVDNDEVDVPEDMLEEIGV